MTILETYRDCFPLVDILDREVVWTVYRAEFYEVRLL